jgi:hypothetical protein
VPDLPSLSDGRDRAGAAGAETAPSAGKGGPGRAPAPARSDPGGLRRSDADGLRLLDPEDSLWFNPARALEEVARVGAAPLAPRARDDPPAPRPGRAGPGQLGPAAAGI